MERILGVKIELPEQLNQQAGALARALLDMRADDVGRLIGTLREQKEAIERATSTEEDDDLPDVPDTTGYGYDG